ncbi:hypothetical protein FPKKA176_contig00043-0008 [Flavobacterium psychrophilum]|jgi:cell fate regulator YaaT (PSP1 superfamily)|nr:hypothetical protein FPK15_contig00034-0009 [Flavobacterium psychrophilum]GEJ29720.1 hypothetical protein FPN181_contig00001-0008 [Flavobacterium psychrophilum]GEJ35522.1 hypothetical protein FPN187_contig00021-0006 [Flavobacterium psychrophilum]GEJ38539.1 hypothetical protein FPN184_contig00076-0006 [Flavobacterium psychrophilum]GEJ40357.1 hypothetical protein FPN182_contig00039-0008 [Flavobacterium psychrophilum]
MTLPGGQAPFDCVEVRFKNGRKEFYRNSEKLTLSIGDIVATEASPGHDVGIVTLTGELVKVQMKKKAVNHEGEVAKIYRKASQKDIDIWSTAREREEPMKVRAREMAIALKLQMKISDIEFQGDGSKATFYYTAEDRVDFRQLIRDFASAFSTRVEMKQVGFRQEAARLGGIGSCGRELCCSTWLTDFRSVNTSAARYQQLSLNPQKLAGQCGKLKCCLNYELDTYMDALKDIPDMETKLSTEKGDAICQKIDIFKGLMWFAYIGNFAQWHILKVAQVKEIMAQNKEKIKVTALEDFAVEIEKPAVEKTFQNAMGQDSLTRFDQPKKSNNNKKPNRNRRPEIVGKEKNVNVAPKVIQKITPNLKPNKPEQVKLKPNNPNQNKANSNNPNQNKANQNNPNQTRPTQPKPKTNGPKIRNEKKDSNK